MPRPPFKTDDLWLGGRAPRRGRSFLAQLHLMRGLLAILWAVAFSKAHHELDASAIALLVAYPLIDALSSMIDYRNSAIRSDRRIVGLNGLLSTVTAAGLGVAALFGMGPVLAVFGAWAVISGAAQLLLGMERRGSDLGRQWPMLIAGGLSFMVGFLYVVQATETAPTLDILPVYATGGGAFFILQAALLGWRTRRQQRDWLLR